MDARIGRGQLPRARVAADITSKARPHFHAGVSGLAPALGVYGIATALMVYRAPFMLGDKWAWLALIVVPVLTLLVTFLRTGTALAMVLVYAFASVTIMAVQGYRMGWTDIAQAEYVLSHFATIFFMAGSVGLVAQLRNKQTSLERAQALVRRYVSEDETTGLLTVDAFKAAAAREVSRSHRTARPLLFMTIDLSTYFDTARGSATVAVAERMFADILTSQTRSGQDLWTMWEKDLYLGLLIETGDQAIEPALERVLARVATADEFAGHAVVTGARFGVASYPDDGQTLDSLIALALGDRMTYEQLHTRIITPRLGAQTTRETKVASPC